MGNLEKVPEREDDVIRKLPTDANLAMQARAEIMPVLERLAEIQNKYISHGLVVGWSIQRDQYGRNRPSSIDVLRPL